MADRKLIRNTLRPKFIYSCTYGTNLLFMTNLTSGEQFCSHKRGFQFKDYCRRSELSGGSLLITGGWEEKTQREVAKIDTQREWVVSYQTSHAHC
jgi:hypothetical protein